jgi:hypothetical protein
LALRVGYVGLGSEAIGPLGAAVRWNRVVPGGGRPKVPQGARRTLNNQLRTGTDKGNLTV